MRLCDVTPANRPYRPFGAARDLLFNRSDEVLLSGPAGTGKSRACLEKLHLCAEKYPGCRILILRKTRVSLTDTGLVTFESHVVPERHPILEGPTRATRRAYTYPNGSEIVLGGMDSPIKVMSSEYDISYVQEATELDEGEWESITTRLRNGKVPYQQLVADCNPGPRTHWLKRRCDAGSTVMLHSRHEDNPRLYDADKGTWTPEGEAYIARLDRLSGSRYERLRKGLWVSAEGLVYEDYDANIHLVDRFDVPGDWKRYLVIDFGYTNPFVAQWWAEDPDGRLVLYREIYHTQRLVEDHAREIKRLSQGEPKYDSVICDHDAEGRATLERHLGVKTTAATKSLSPGIQAVQTRLRPAGDKKPRLTIMRDSLVRRDQDLFEAKKPCSTAEEFEGYVWSDKSRKEEPVKEDDHGCLVAETLVTTDRGRVRIDCIRNGDKVLTRYGYRPVTAAGQTSAGASIFEVSLSDGSILAGTDDHPVFVRGRGYVKIADLRPGDPVVTERGGVACRRRALVRKRSFSAGSRFGVIQSQVSGQKETTTLRTLGTGAVVSAGCTRRFGNGRTAKYRTGATSTTKTETRSTTKSATWSASLVASTQRCTSARSRRRDWTSCDGAWITRGNTHHGGTDPTPAEPGTVNWAGHRGRTKARPRWSAIIAAASTRLGYHVQRALGSAPTGVRRLREGLPASTSSTLRADTADPTSHTTRTRKGHSAHAHVLSVRATGEIRPVYNLTVDAPVGEFFANGCLVHNCDATRYMVAHRDCRVERRPGRVVTW